jgi:hypothetical protein
MWAGRPTDMPRYTHGWPNTLRWDASVGRTQPMDPTGANRVKPQYTANFTTNYPVYTP